MRIGLVSDTHGELENLREALRQLTQVHKMEKIVHLGDEWEDSEVFRELLGIDVLVIPGVYASQYLDPAIPNRVIGSFEGWQVLFTHTSDAHTRDLPGDLDPKELAAAQKIDVVAYSHTHIPAVEIKDYVLWVNPGHLKTGDKRGYPPSYGVLDIQPEEVETRIFNLYSKESSVQQRFTKKKVTIQTSDLKIRAILNNTWTAQKIWDALPIEGKASLWGEEIYLCTPVEAEIEDGQETVQLGDIGYWPPGQAVCLFFGPTPVSTSDEIRPYSSVTVVGKLADNPKELKTVGEKENIKMTRSW